MHVFLLPLRNQIFLDNEGEIRRSDPIALQVKCVMTVMACIGLAYLKCMEGDAHVMTLFGLLRDVELAGCEYAVLY